MPTTYAVTLLKGGAGKTTTAVMLGEAAAERGWPTLVVDADPQMTASAAAWAELAQEDGGEGLRSTVIALASRDLARRLPTLAAGVKRVVVDTPPGRTDLVEAAIEAADLVVVPTAAAAMDVSRAVTTVEVASEMGKPAVVVLVRTRPVKATQEARETLVELGVTVAETEVPLRETLAAAYGTRPRGRALSIYEELLSELEDTKWRR